jgi:hypothetical protein
MPYRPCPALPAAALPAAALPAAALPAAALPADALPADALPAVDEDFFIMRDPPWVIWESPPKAPENVWEHCKTFDHVSAFEAWKDNKKFMWRVAACSKNKNNETGDFDWKIYSCGIHDNCQARAK